MDGRVPRPGDRVRGLANFGPTVLAWGEVVTVASSGDARFPYRILTRFSGVIDGEARVFEHANKITAAGRDVHDYISEYRHQQVGAGHVR